MLLSAIVVSVVGLILSSGFVEDIFIQLGEAVIHSQSGHLQVAKAGYFTEGARRPEQYVVPDAQPLKRRIAALDMVEGTMARLNFSGLINNGRADLPIVGEGIEAEPEARLGTYVAMRSGRHLVGADRYAVLVGEGLAHALQLRPGDV